VPVDELATWLVDADVGLVLFAPVELNNILATPNKLFEYMSAAVPVVVSRFPELERIVTETGCGITADPTQPNDVAAAIRSLLADDGRRRELGRNGFVAAQDRYNWEVQAERLVGVYRDLPSPASISQMPASR
jgi:glycosyltransferase involved in cell wall biosynthesis